MSSFDVIAEGYRVLIEEKIKEKVVAFGDKMLLRDACEYALLGGGKRFRPTLVLMMGKALGLGRDLLEAAMAIEFFHTASLIADDLPSMDDDNERRGRPSLHRVYGESLALLASYALIAEGYGCIAKNSQASPDREVCLVALENAAHNTGFLGASGGQFPDLSPPDFSEATLREIIHKKTTSLFEVAFVFGWLFGGGGVTKLHCVKRAASHFGMAFQVADDIDDFDEDSLKGKKINYAVAFGKDEAVRVFHEELESFWREMGGLGIRVEEWLALTEQMRVFL